uniref:DM13 domain-containing protein n=2 Tax=Roseivirga sp. TaxID=1964215 RepID=UPI004048DF25
MKSIKHIFLLIPMFLLGCIGTDIVEDTIVPVRLSIGNQVSELRVGDSFEFTADYFNEYGEPTPVQINWSSSNPMIISIDNNGLATANTEGTATISANFGEVRDEISVIAGANTTETSTKRTGTFSGVNNYQVSGGFSLSEVSGGLELTFDENFRASQGPGLFVYLTNQSNGVAGAIEVGRLTKNSGSQTYMIEGDVQLRTYNFVLIYCKPFGVTFGRGTFNN